MKHLHWQNAEKDLFLFVFLFLTAISFAKAQYVVPIINESLWIPIVLKDSNNDSSKPYFSKRHSISTSSPENELFLQKTRAGSYSIASLDLRSTFLKNPNNSIEHFFKTSQSVHNKSSNYSLVFSMAVQKNVPFLCLPKSSMFKRTNHLAYLIRADRPTHINQHVQPEPLLAQTVPSLPSAAAIQTLSTLAQAKRQIS